MKTLPIRCFILTAMIMVSGCTTVFSPSEPLTIKAVITEEFITEFGNFTNACYVDQRVLVRIVEPSVMKDEVIAISLADGWTPNVREHLGTEYWDKPIGSVVEFQVKSRDLRKGWPSAPRRIDADKIRTVIWHLITDTRPPSPDTAAAPTAP